MGMASMSARLGGIVAPIIIPLVSSFVVKPGLHLTFFLTI